MTRYRATIPLADLLHILLERTAVHYQYDRPFRSTDTQEPSDFADRLC